MLLYSTYGGTWVYGQRITYSFVPDGTNIGGLSSNLFATLNKIAPTATWEAAFEKAAAVWSTYAGINLALVSDNGEVSGATGDQQDDPSVGDIRIGMVSQSGGTVAVTFLPPPFNGGTLAGDMVLNSNIGWGMNTGADVETVALHEFGHALGLGENTSDPTTVMYYTYTGVKQNLASDDIAGIQSIWGPSPTTTPQNSTFATATNLNSLLNASTAQIALSGQNLEAISNDYNWFSATVPSNTNGTMTVTLQSSNLSSLTLHLVVENSAGKLLGQSSSTNLGSTVSYTVTGVAPGQTYYFRAAAQTSPGLVGSYGVLVNFASLAQNPIAPPNTMVAAQPDRGGGFDYLHGGQIDDPGLLALGNISSLGESMTISPALLANGPGWASLMPNIFSLLPTTLAPGAMGPTSAATPFGIAIAPLVTPGILDSALSSLNQAGSLLDQLAAELLNNFNT